jgi:hypothetical protein
MATRRRTTTTEEVADPAALRRCIGSKTFGIEPHDAPVSDFPIQPSQKDGLGRMCKPHWNQYTSALRKAALTRNVAAAEAPKPEPRATRRRKAVDQDPAPATSGPVRESPSP